jgi:hypothetical protein
MRIYVINFLIGALSLSILIGCDKKVENEALEGTWSIDTLYYRAYDIRNCVLVNVINFEHDFCKLPTTESYCEGLIEYTDTGIWKTNRTDSTPLVLEIESQNKIFSGNHRIIFKKDKRNKLLKIELRSDSLYVVCRKGLFDYDRYENLTDELVNLSH